MLFNPVLTEIVALSLDTIEAMKQTTFFEALQDKTQSVTDVFTARDVPYLQAYTKAVRTVIKRAQTQPCVLNAEDITALEEVAAHVDEYIESLIPRRDEFFAVKLKPIICPSIQAYIHHLERTTETQSLEEAIACLMPCMYIYHVHLGPALKQSECARGNPDQNLIESFYDLSFCRDASLLESILDKITTWAEPHSTLEQGVRHAFLSSCTHELSFFHELGQHPHAFATVPFLGSR